MRASDRVTGVGIRIPLCTCTLKAARRGRRPRCPVSARLLFLSVGANDPVRPVPLSFRASARTGVGIRFPLPPSAREVAARSADGGSDIARQFLSSSRLRRQPPPSGGLAARRCRADGTSYPKGICSAALHCRTPSPTVVMRQVRLSFRRGRCPHRPTGKAVFCGGTHGSRPTKNHGRPNVKRHIPLTASSGCPPRRRAKSRIRPRCGREWPRRSAAPAPPAPDWC